MMYILSARFQLENWNAPAWPDSARNLFSSAQLSSENFSSNSSLLVVLQILRHPIMVAHIIVVQCISTPNSQGCSVFAAKFPDVSLLKNSKIQILLTFYCICKILSCTIAVCTAVKIVIQLI